MRDDALFLGTVGTFAVGVTVHVTILLGLLARVPRWKAAVALLVPPTAPYWAFRGGMRVRCALWMLAWVAYGGLWLSARR